MRQTLSYLDQPDPLFLGQGGGTFVVLGLDPGAGRVDQLVPALRAVTIGLEARLRASAPSLRLRITGEGPINYDIWRTSADDVKHAERRTLPVTLALLLAAFGAVAAALAAGRVRRAGGAAHARSRRRSSPRGCRSRSWR